MGHTGTQFCAFCSETDLEAVELDPAKARDEETVRQQAQVWRGT